MMHPRVREEVENGIVDEGLDRAQGEVAVGVAGVTDGDEDVLTPRREGAYRVLRRGSRTTATVGSWW